MYRSIFIVIALVAPVWAGGASALTAPATPALEIQRDVRDLASTSAATRTGAEVRLYTLGPESFATVEAAARGNLAPDAAARLKEIVDHLRPLIAPRLLLLKKADVFRKWNQSTALDAYNAAGKRNPKWDALARQGIELLTSSRSNTKEARAVLEKAIEAGCDDPLVVYFDARAIGILGAGVDPMSLDELWGNAVKGMYEGKYPADRKCFTDLRYCSYMLARGRTAAGPRNPLPMDVRLGIARTATVALNLWPQVVKEPGIPPQTLLDLAGTFFQLPRNSRVDARPIFEQLYKPLQHLLPGSPIPLIFKGEFYVQYAWDARGSGYANTVTDQGRKLMAERLDIASAALTQAYEMDPTNPDPPTQMLQVELGQGKGRPVMETWFARAMKANPDNLDACNKKLYYLEPKWYGNGSPDQMLAFARECRDSQNWYGRLPFLLVDAHQTLSSYVKEPDAYFRDPAVWSDIRSVYQPWLQAWPDASWDRSRYAYWACRCGKWAVAKRQFEILGDKAVPGRFGGTDKMQQMREQAIVGSNDAP